MLHEAKGGRAPLWSASWHLFKRIFVLFLSVTLLETILDSVFFEIEDGWLLWVEPMLFFLVATIFAFVAHKSQLEGTRFTLRDFASPIWLPNRAFLFLTFSGSGVFLCKALLVGFILNSLMGDIISETVLFVGSITLAALGYLLLLARYGTVFPAAAAEAKLDFRAAHDKGRNTFRPLLRDLLLGAVLVHALFFGPVVLWAMTKPKDYTASYNADDHIWNLLLMVSGSLVQSFAMLLGVVAFCKAYHTGHAQINGQPG